MANPDKVLDCCRYHWERPRDIGMRYDELYPPKWYEFFRQWRKSQLPNRPSVGLHYELAFLHDKGHLELKFEEVEIFLAPDGRPLSFPMIWYKLKPGGLRVRKELPAQLPVPQLI